MAYGEIVKFDSVTGCGFITPDEGGPEVYVHSDDLGGLKDVAAGTVVRFSVIQGARWPRAYNVCILHAGVEGRRWGSRSSAPKTGESVVDEKIDLHEVQVLSNRDYLEEVTDILISSLPEATVTQVIEIRSQLARRAIWHGWVATSSDRAEISA